MAKALEVMVEDVDSRLIWMIGKVGKIAVKWQGKKRDPKDATIAECDGVYGVFFDFYTEFAGKKGIAEYNDRLSLEQVQTIFADRNENDAREILIMNGDKPEAVYIGVVTLAHYAFMDQLKTDPEMRARFVKGLAEAKRALAEPLANGEKLMTLDQLLARVRDQPKAKTISVTELKKNLFRIVREIEKKKTAYLITRRGKPVARLGPIEDVKEESVSEKK